jgi:hypothetical protein
MGTEQSNDKTEEAMLQYLLDIPFLAGFKMERGLTGNAVCTFLVSP